MKSQIALFPRRRSWLTESTDGTQRFIDLVCETEVIKPGPTSYRPMVSTWYYCKQKIPLVDFNGSAILNLIWLTHQSGTHSLHRYQLVIELSESDRWGEFQRRKLLHLFWFDCWTADGEWAVISEHVHWQILKQILNQVQAVRWPETDARGCMGELQWVRDAHFT